MVVRIELFSDLACPYAYLATHRAREIIPEFDGRVEIVPRALPMELHARAPTSKPIIDAETSLVLLDAPNLAYKPWAAADSTWPTTLLPAYEAVKCAAGQSPALGSALDWRIRTAFFGESRCVNLRHELLDLAQEIGADATEMEAAFDHGAHRAEVMADAKRGWTELGLRMSPTFVLQSGKRYENPAAPTVHLDDHNRVVRVDEAPEHGDAALDAYREMFHDALAAAGERLPA